MANGRIGPRNFEFLVIYSPGPSYHRDQSPQAQTPPQRAQFLASLRQQGKLIWGGEVPATAPAEEFWRDTLLLTVPSAEEAHALAAQDPAVASGVLAVQVRPWDIKFGINLPF